MLGRQSILRKAQQVQCSEYPKYDLEQDLHAII